MSIHKNCFSAQLCFCFALAKAKSLLCCLPSALLRSRAKWSPGYSFSFCIAGFSSSLRRVCLILCTTADKWRSFLVTAVPQQKHRDRKCSVLNSLKVAFEWQACPNSRVLWHVFSFANAGSAAETVLKGRQMFDCFKCVSSTLWVGVCGVFFLQAVKCSDQYSGADLCRQIPSAFLIGCCKNLWSKLRWTYCKGINNWNYV